VRLFNPSPPKQPTNKKRNEDEEAAKKEKERKEGRKRKTKGLAQNKSSHSELLNVFRLAP
jgi:hypothetical protein